jgi:hypothetical protein
MTSVAARFGVLTALAVSTLLTACSGNCDDETEAAQQFLSKATNLSCVSDSDCEVVSTGCGHPARSLCGQAQLNHTAAASTAWKVLQDELTDCSNECVNCAARVTPVCRDGFCGGPP